MNERGDSKLINDCFKEQKKICKKYGAPFVESPEDMILGVADNVIQGLQPINGERFNIEDGTVGWYIWGGEEFSEDDDFFKPMRVKDLISECPVITKYLGLAPGWKFLVDNKGYEDVWEDPSLLDADDDGEMTFYCAACAEMHAGPMMSYSFVAPALALSIDEGELDERVELREETCIVKDKDDSEHYFMKGNIELKVAGKVEAFVWTCWVALSEDDYSRAMELWTAPGRADERAYLGRLASQLPGYPNTMNLMVKVQTREVGKRPLVSIELPEHPLAVEQSDGISMVRVAEIAAEVIHADADE